ncbi:MAG: hypothetical protein U1F06_06185 [Steroidobacteraceae bacterium]
MKNAGIACLATVAIGCAAMAQGAGWFSRKSAPPPDPNGMPSPQGMDCSMLASIPNAPMTIEQCEAMKSMAMGAQAHLDDTSGARPGDEQMSCADIGAEMKGMRGIGPTAGHVQQGQEAAADLKRTMDRQEAETGALVAAETATMATAAAADRATEIASGGLVSGHAAAAASESMMKANQAFGERNARERAPKEQAAISAVVATGNDMNQSMESNPRFARLVKLAIDRRCREEVN